MLNEMAWSVGEILQTLRELNIEEDTLVIFTSDNSPAIDVCLDGGSAGPFSGKFIFNFRLYFLIK